MDELIALQLAASMKSQARDEVGVGNSKLQIGKAKFSAIFSLCIW